MKRLAIIATLAAVPVLAFAQTAPLQGDAGGFLRAIQNLVNAAIPIVIGLAVLGFLWGLAKFVFAAGDEGAKDEGKRIMIWGIIALFVMVSVYGLVGFVGRALGVGQGGTIQAPVVPPSRI